MKKKNGNFPNKSRSFRSISFSPLFWTTTPFASILHSTFTFVLKNQLSRANSMPIQSRCPRRPSSFGCVGVQFFISLSLSPPFFQISILLFFPADSSTSDNAGFLVLLLLTARRGEISRKKVIHFFDVEYFVKKIQCHVSSYYSVLFPFSTFQPSVLVTVHVKANGFFPDIFCK